MVPGRKWRKTMFEKNIAAKKQRRFLRFALALVHYHKIRFSASSGNWGVQATSFAQQLGFTKRVGSLMTIAGLLVFLSSWVSLSEWVTLREGLTQPT